MPGGLAMDSWAENRAVARNAVSSEQIIDASWASLFYGDILRLQIEKKLYLISGNFCNPI